MLYSLAKKLGLRYVIVLGSMARSGRERDVDLVVKLGKKPLIAIEIGRIQ